MKGDDGCVVAFEDDEFHAVQKDLGLDLFLDALERLTREGQVHEDENGQDKSRQ
jgi:hypothetical protein